MRKLLIGIAILTILGIAAILFFIPDSALRLNLFLAKLSNAREIANPPADLLAAKARWTANSINHYRLKVQHNMSTYPFVNCLQDLEIVNENIVTIFEDSCSANGYLQHFAPLGSTVRELFAKFQKETTTIRFKEQDDPAGCDDFLSVDISYAPAGYPTNAKYSWSKVSPWNVGPQTYKTIYGDEPRFITCSMAADPREPNITITLQPLS